MRALRAIVPVLLTLTSAILAFASEDPLDPQAVTSVTAQNVTLQGDTVSGTISNAGKHPIRDVQLQIDYVWFWTNERHPGTDNPGRTDFYTLSGEIPVGGSAPFTYRPSAPLAHRTDGHFGPSVQVVGFTEIVP